MKIVNTGIKYQIYDDSLRTFDSLPAATYCVRFSKLSGFYLESRPNMQVNETVYGPHESKVEKVIAPCNSFPAQNRIANSGRFCVPTACPLPSPPMISPNKSGICKNRWFE